MRSSSRFVVPGNLHTEDRRKLLWDIQQGLNNLVTSGKLDSKDELLETVLLPHVLYHLPREPNGSIDGCRNFSRCNPLQITKTPVTFFSVATIPKPTFLFLSPYVGTPSIHLLLVISPHCVLFASSLLHPLKRPPSTLRPQPHEFGAASL